MRNSEGEECKLDNLAPLANNMKRSTDEKLALFGEKSNLVCLQSGIEKSIIATEKLPDLPTQEEEQALTKNKESHAIHGDNNLHVEKMYHAESAKKLYKTLSTLGNVRTDPEYRLFVNVLSEDIAPNAKTGASVDNIQDTWLGNNGETNGRGVFNALHYKDGGVGKMGEIQNATFLEYKADEDPNPKKKTVSNIAIFKRGYASELQQIKGSAQQLHLEFLQNSAEIIADAKNLEQNAIAKKEIPTFFRFLNT